MLKVIAASMVFVLVVGSGAFAGLIQDMGTTVGLSNAIDLLNGTQQANTLQNLVVDNTQCAPEGHESLFATIGQAGNAQGNCAILGLAQLLQIEGTQSQEVNDGIGAKGQIEGLAFGAQQTLAKADGQGFANALHTIVLNANQGISNHAGNLCESSTAMGIQDSTVCGQPGATNLVDSTMGVCTTQSQIAQ